MTIWKIVGVVGIALVLFTATLALWAVASLS